MRPAAWALVALPLALAGCVTVVPSDLAGQVNRQVSGGQLIAEPERYRGQLVVVGGEIIAVNSAPGTTELELLERPLEFDEPVFTDRSGGRFLVRHAGFLDPVVYAVGRRLTVVGTVAEAAERKIGEMSYRYPVVDARHLELWPIKTAFRNYGPYPGYDPFWGPYWYRDPRWDPYWWSRFHR